MRLLEHQARRLLGGFGLPFSPSTLVTSAVEAERAAASLNGPVVLKAQLPFGGRGKMGAVLFAESPQEARDAARRLFAMEPRGCPVRAVTVETRVTVVRELYAGIAWDAAARLPVAILSTAGGIDVERAGATDVARVTFDPFIGLRAFQGREMARSLGLNGKTLAGAGAALEKLAAAFLQLDGVTTEINPLVETTENALVGLDAHVEIDDDAAYRLKERLEPLGQIDAYSAGRPPTRRASGVRAARCLPRRNPVPGDRRKLFHFPAGDVTHTWTLKYDPTGNNGGGMLTATIGDQTVTAEIRPGHKADGATFNRFGLLNMMRHADPRAGSIWIDDLRLNGKEESFDRDPKWDGFQNRRTYTTTYVRPRFDFGYSKTHFAGGKAPGEMGGLIFLGDQQDPERMAYYGDRIEELTLDKPLRASGKIALQQCVTDSMGLIGFFHSTDSMKTGTAQTSIAPENFLGFAVEGPSDEGFYVYPYFGSSRPDQPPETSRSQQGVRQHIYPDGKSHDWTLEYVPAGADGQPRITVTLDGQPYSVALPPEDKAAGAHFNRFGIITTHVDGNGLKVYFDDLTYTFRSNGSAQVAVGGAAQWLMATRTSPGST
ncbi:MAG TPA: ATP-grasp domain-containing protein [Tepidisphaeraceae bacterium]|nr:ATP-grasp domain-containing protein [Tepidisphaeraceae bacterium]